MDEFSILIDELPYDVVTVSETWQDSAVENTILAIEGYNLFRFDRDRQLDDKKKKGGGAGGWSLLLCHF